MDLYTISLCECKSSEKNLAEVRVNVCTVIVTCNTAIIQYMECVQSFNFFLICLVNLDNYLFILCPQIS